MDVTKPRAEQTRESGTNYVVFVSGDAFQACRRAIHQEIAFAAAFAVRRTPHRA